MAINFTISETHDNLVTWGVRTNCAISFIVDILTIYLLWTKTPRHTGAYKYLLITMQCLSAMIDVHIGLLFAPIPLFPIIGVYCKGVLCMMSDPHICVVTFFAIVLGCLIMLNLCVFYRHQSILHPSHTLKITKKRYRNFLCFIYILSIEAMPMLVVFADHESVGRSEYLAKYQPAMLWITRKPSWIVYDPESNTRYVIYYVIIVLPIQGPLFLFLIRHIYKLLNDRITEMSSRTLAYHRVMINSLVMQSTCWLFVCFPMIVWLASVLTELLPIECTSVAFLITELFPLVNATTMIMNTPRFRHTVMFFIGFRSKRRHTVQTTSIAFSTTTASR